MSYYQVNLRGHPVAIVKTIDMAETIVRCRRRGHYVIEKFEGGEDIPSSTKLRQKTPTPKRSGRTTSKLARPRACNTTKKALSGKPARSH
jgi:hypothetical protein